jgi:L-seryl-tRNA(Ser) seleniumtransferase
MYLTDMLSDRRAFLKWIGALPTLSAFAAEDLMARAQKATGYSAKENIYTRIGVTPIINARGTWTYTSASLELPEVKAAKQEAALHFVDMWELERGVGKRLAELSGAESGMVTAGAAAAMATATAACLAGTDPAKVWQLPDTTGMKHEVVMFGGRISFDNAIRAVGGKLVVAYSHDELKAALNDNTAMVYTTKRGEDLEKAIPITKAAKVPILVDWAAGIPPIENLGLPWKMGADLYTFSGGKGMCGPQCSGLLLGRKDLIEAAWAQSCPWEGAVCRAMKVGKEEIMGLLAAVEAWKKYDLATLDKEWNRRVKKVAQLAETVPGVTTDIQTPPNGNRYPTLTVTWDEAAFKLSVQECAKKLRTGSPPIETLTNNNPSTVPGLRMPRDPKAPAPPARRTDALRVVALTLQPGEELIVGRRIREVLMEARKSAGV